jgi:hypothetical protein
MLARYQNGVFGKSNLRTSGSATAINSDAQASTGLNATNALVIGSRNIGTGLVNTTSRQYSAAWLGGGFTGPQYAQLAARINA